MKLRQTLAEGYPTVLIVVASNILRRTWRCTSGLELLQMGHLTLLICAEEKFRRVKLSNPKIKAALVDVPGAMQALLVLGWAREQEPEEAVVVPKGRHFSMAEASPNSDMHQLSPAGPCLLRS